MEEKKMEKMHALLHRKLKEIESLLKKDVFLQPSDTASYNDVCKEVEQKFIFIRYLLAAETNSDEAYRHHHLQHIAERLSKLEHGHLRLLSSAGNSGTNHIDDDSTSTCSCTESCFNDHEEELGDGGSLTYEDAEMFAEGFDGEKAVVKFDGQKGLLVGDGIEKENVPKRPENIYQSFNGGNAMVNFDIGLSKQKGDVKEEKYKTRIVHNKDRGVTGTVWLFSAVALGIGLGMVFMGWVMVSFSGCLCILEEASFPVPT